MDTMATLLAALVAGAAAALQTTAGDAIKDAYSALKGLLAKRFSGVDVKVIEGDPTAPENRSALERQLRESGASGDADLLARAQTLLDEVARNRPELTKVIGVDLERIKAGTIRIDDIVSSGAGVRVKGAEAGGDFVVSNVRAGGTGSAPGKL